jgi:hypothetical protein
MDKENEIFSREQVNRAVFDWKDLDGKTLTIKVIENENGLMVAGIDTDKFYVLHTEIKPE